MTARVATARAVRARMVAVLLALLSLLAQCLAGGCVRGQGPGAPVRERDREDDMLMIGYQPVFVEAVTLKDGRLHVAGQLSPEDPELFEYDAAAPSAAADYRDILGQIRASGEQSVKGVPEPGYEGPWFAGNPQSEQVAERRLILSDRLQPSSPLLVSLVALDREASLAVRSARGWINAARTTLEINDTEHAYACARAAVFRLRLPYIQVLAKDDSAMKLKAARATYDAGRAADAVNVLIQAAEGRIKLLEEKWAPAAR